MANSDIIPHYKNLTEQSVSILDSYKHWFRRPLLEIKDDSDAQIAQSLFEAPMVVLAAENSSDPFLNYGNLQALKLWETTWNELLKTRGRETAEVIEQKQRASFLSQVNQKGYIDNYEVIRISKTGKRFWIKNVKVWKVFDKFKNNIGQAATFSHWEYL